MAVSTKVGPATCEPILRRCSARFPGYPVTSAVQRMLAAFMAERAYIFIRLRLTGVVAVRYYHSPLAPACMISVSVSRTLMASVLSVVLSLGS